MKSNLIFSALCSLLFLAPAPAALVNNRGLWDFNGNFNAWWNCFSPADASSLTAGLDYSFASAGGFQYLQTSAFPTAAKRLSLSHVIGPNGGPAATRSNQWSLVMDVRFDALQPYAGLLQTNPANDTDVTFYLASTNNLTAGLRAGGALLTGSAALARDTWYRIGLTCGNDGAGGALTIKCYINGVLSGTLANQALNGAYALRSSFLLLSDNNAEVQPAKLNSVGLWGEELSAADLDTLGAAQGFGLTWPGFSSSGCPLPVLTGNLYFGGESGFATTFNPAALTNNPAAVAGPAASAPFVAATTLGLSPTGGAIPGTQHTFGNSIPVVVRPNGNLVYNGADVDVLVTAPSDPDFGNANGIVFERGRVFLNRNGARTGALRLTFPAGFGVAMDGESRRRKSSVMTDALVNLGAGLIPAFPLSWDRTYFKDANADPYPAGLIYASVDRLPVKWEISSFSWNAAQGLIRFLPVVSAGPVPHSGNPELTEFNQQAVNVPGLQDESARRSNDYLYLRANGGGGPVNIGAAAGGQAKVVEATLTLNQGNFRPHFPAGAQISWSGPGSLILQDGEILGGPGNSEIRGISNVVQSYQSGVPVTDPDCPDTGSRTTNITLTPGARWGFTRDGGLIGSVTASPATLPWGQYQVGNTGTLFNPHRLENATAGTFLTAGHVMLWNDLDGTPDPALTVGSVTQRPGHLLLAGHSAEGGLARAERPGSVAYQNGEASYPGVNFSRAAGGVSQATARLAGQAVPAFPLAASSKYYFRAGGLSGRHVSAGGALNLSIYGFPAKLSSLALAFRDSINTESGITGNLTIPTFKNTTGSAPLTLAFSRLIFGQRGELLATSLDSTDPISLGYWQNQFVPAALGFAQPAAINCVLPDPAIGSINLTGSARVPALTTGEFTGTLGFRIASNQTVLVTGGDFPPQKTPAGNVITSRLRPPASEFTLARPAGTPWKFRPATDLYFNNPSPLGTNSGVPANPLPFVSMGGRVLTPFFGEVPVHVTAASAASGDPSSIRLTGGWAASSPPNAAPVYGDGDPLGGPAFDTLNRGHVTGYDRNSYSNQQAYATRVKRAWLGVLDFDLPITYQNSTGRFATPASATTAEDTVLFKLYQQVQNLTPEAAELTFDASVSAPNQLSFGTLLADSGLLSSLNGATGNQLGKITDAVKEFDNLLADIQESLFDSTLGAATDSLVTPTFYNSLRTAYTNNPATYAGTASTQLAGLRAQFISTALPGQFNGGGQYVAKITGILDKVLAGLSSARTFTSGAVHVSQFVDLALAIKSAMGGSGAPAENDSLTASLQQLDDALARIQSNLQAARNTISGGTGLMLILRDLISTDSGGTLTNALNQQLSAVTTKWSALDAPGGSFFNEHPIAELRADVKAALRDAFFASSPCTSIQQQLKLTFADLQYSFRETTDSLLTQASQAGQGVSGGPAEGLGEVTNFFGGANLHGYGRINGNSLKELRIDGDMKLKVPEALTLAGYVHIRDQDTTTPESACRSGGAAKAELDLGASISFPASSGGSPGSFGPLSNSTPVKINFDAKLGLNNSGSPVSINGALGLDGEVKMKDISIKKLQFLFGLGKNEAYLAAALSGSLELFDVAGGLFIGQTCSLDPITAVAGPNVSDNLTALNVAPDATNATLGAYLGAEGALSLPPLIGIPPSCLLDLRLGGGPAYYAMAKRPVNGSPGPYTLAVGFKNVYTVSGELACLVDVGGRLEIVGGVSVPSSSPFDNARLDGRGSATFTAEIGYSPFSWDFEKTIGVSFTFDNAASPKTKWDADF